MMHDQWTGLAMYAVASGAAILIGVIGGWRSDRRRIRRQVFENLDSAYRNGYFEPGEYLNCMSPDEIAYDMTVYAEDCAPMEGPTLAQYVREWQYQKGMELT